MTPLKRTLWWMVLLTVVGAVLLFIAHSAFESSIGKPLRSGTSAETRRRLAVEGAVRHGDGEPAAGAQVTVIWRTRAGEPGRTTVRAAANGRFVVAGLSGLGEGGRITGVQARAGPLFTQAEPDELPRPGERAELDLELPHAFRIAGLVQRVEDRGAVAGARVECAGVVSASDDGGGFELNDIPSSVLRDEGLVVLVTAPERAKLRWDVPRDLLPPQYEDVLLLLLPVPDGR